MENKKDFLINLESDVGAGVAYKNQSRVPSPQSPVLKDYNISDNIITAYYDDAGALLFVLDKTIDADKLNVLLVLEPRGGRKWDDILVNDFGVDLETVRPRKNNKYQKLDIEYGGLDVYRRMIETQSADELNAFRDRVSRRIATDRLAAANGTIAKSKDTISKADVSVNELSARVKQLRTKLSRQKKEIGKIPPKQSGARILKTESQIDATDEKLKRARRRIANARRRLATAENDAMAAQKILDTGTDIVRAIEPKADKMAKDEVKPLFDKDPEIIDEKIAFKSIDFDIPVKDLKPVSETVEPEIKITEPIVIPEFTPPTFSATPEIVEKTPASVEIVEEKPLIAESVVDKPVLDSIIKVPEPVIVKEESPVPGPQSPIARPVSPLTGGITPADVSHSRPTVIYYVMLGLLIILSVFTLWLYQKKTTDDIAPNLAAPVKTANAPAPTPTPTPAVPEPAPIIVPDVIAPIPVAVIDTPESSPEPVANESMEKCQDGANPDQFGCCAGEVHSVLENGDSACCTDIMGADGNPLCYPPL